MTVRDDVERELQKQGLSFKEKVFMVGCHELFDKTKEHPLAEALWILNDEGHTIGEIRCDSYDTSPPYFVYFIHTNVPHDPNSIGNIVDFVNKKLEG